MKTYLGEFMKNKKIIVFSNKTPTVFIKTIVIKYSFPKTCDFIKLFNSVNWERNTKRVRENKKNTTFAVGLYIDNQIVGMGRVLADYSYFTIYDIVVDKEYQWLGLGIFIMNEIVN